MWFKLDINQWIKDWILGIQIFIICKIFRHHKPTALVEEGIQPDPEKIKADPIGYFNEYSRIYCKRCNKILREIK